MVFAYRNSDNAIGRNICIEYYLNNTYSIIVDSNIYLHAMGLPPCLQGCFGDFHSSSYNVISHALAGAVGHDEAAGRGLGAVTASPGAPTRA